MAKENYTQMSNEELYNLLLDLKNNIRFLDKFLRYHEKDLYNEIVSRTKFLEEFYDKNTYIPIDARLYCIEHDIKTSPICQRENCGNLVGWDRTNHRFRKYCSCRCQAIDPTMQQQRAETNLKNIGVKHPSQAIDFADKVRQKWNEKTIDEKQRINDKHKDSCMKTLGVEHPAQSSIIQAKMKSTCLKNHGVEHPLQSKEIHNKLVLHNNELYGVDYPIQLDKFKRKMTNTWIRKHEGVGFGSDIVKRAIWDKYHVDNVSQLDCVKERKKQTSIEKWGVDNYAKTAECQKRIHKRYTNPKYPDMTFDSSWEFIVYDFLLENHIVFEYQPAISIPYDYQGTHHTYHPDFLVNGKLYEVKGDIFFRINESTGEEEMFNPYRNPDWTDEQYAESCAKYEAKHQCMIANNVRILRKSDVLNLTTAMFLQLDSDVI